MHKKKVTHVALNPCCDWLLATASVDQTVKIWDLRQVRGKSSFLHSLPHRHPVNAAHFSPDGAQLLTTDQKSEIRVYSACQWDCPPSLIPHPHRHFQHLTPIKVSDGGEAALDRAAAAAAPAPALFSPWLTLHLWSSSVSPFC